MPDSGATTRVLFILNATPVAPGQKPPTVRVTKCEARTLTDSFDADFGVDEWHGHNVFFRDGDKVYRTYFTDNRGDEALGTPWSYLDLTPLGWQEAWEESPGSYPQSPPYKWWNWHDSYEAEAKPDPKRVEISDAGEAAFRDPVQR
jgi:predicted dithiol-disulfide oxidoreductase (DUF899 family)